MKLFTLSVVLPLHVIPWCEDDPSPVSDNPIHSSVTPTDFRQVASSPERFAGEFVVCKFMVAPGSLPFTAFPERRFGGDLEHATKIGRTMCEPSSEFVDILVLPQEEERYFQSGLGIRNGSES